MSGEEIHDHSVSDHPVIKRVNVTNAKKIAVLVVIAFIIYHGILHLSYGEIYFLFNINSIYQSFISGINSCKWLLSDGRFQGYRVWQPYGCMLHTYDKM